MPTPALLLIIRAFSECLWGALGREGSETPWCPGGNKDIDPPAQESSQKPGPDGSISLASALAGSLAVLGGCCRGDNGGIISQGACNHRNCLTAGACGLLHPRKSPGDE
jgi:hypothetical protein